ncbi:MAG: ankyrin repeat domain-containing protein [Vicinamibacterales bacterium]
MSAITDAAKLGDRDAVKRLLADDPSLVTARDESGETPLMSALYRGHMEMVDLLVDAGAPLDLFAAAATGRTDALERNLASFGDAVGSYAYDGWTPLHLAAFFGHTAAAERLLDAGADPKAVSRNSLANTALHAATAGKHSEVALLLIARGADVSAVDSARHTPLHIAAENDLRDVVRALRAAGADPHAVDADDQTPLSRAAAMNLNEVVDLLNS